MVVNLLVLVGLAAIVAGLAWVWLPLGVIAAGLVLLALAAILAVPPRPRRSP